jgi:D-alanine-D-alanine ligase
MGKKHVVVLMGGLSLEHEVSLHSGSKVTENLDRSRYEVTPVVIGRDAQWAFGDAPPVPLPAAVNRLAADRPDAVFIALHGPFGEDGRIQGMLDLLGIPYTGSGCIASGVAMDKVLSKAVADRAGVSVAAQEVLRRRVHGGDPAGTAAGLARRLGLPCVVKSPCQGSSLGMAIPRAEDELAEAIAELFRLDDVILAEAYLTGPEVTCAVLDTDPARPPLALPVTLIRPVASPYFDYEAKYTPGACEEITPAPISMDETHKVQEMAVRAHEALGCRGMSRSDMILVNGEPVWLEANTIPGMTATSLLPQAAAAADISYGDLCGMLVESAAFG